MARRASTWVAVAVFVSTQAFAARPETRPNSERYAERSPSASTGRSGNATLYARALLGMDGQTSLELSTAQLDSSIAAPGTIASVLLKSFNGQGEDAIVKKFGPLSAGGTFSAEFSDFQRGHSLQVQANLRGIDGSRTNVVTVTDLVKLRPDLQVEQINAPSRVAAGAPVHILALVGEANQDVGATANCVLYVDGSEADRVQGLWIDAGDSVSCEFVQIFSTPGAKQLKVALEQVQPADYDLSNNEKTASIEVIGSRLPFEYEASVGWLEYGYDSYNRGWYSLDRSGEPDWKYDYIYKTNSQWAVLLGVAPKAVGFPVEELSVSHATGSELFERTYTNLTADSVFTVGTTNYACSLQSDLGVNTTLCSYTDPVTGVAQTSVDTHRQGGKVVFYSRYYNKLYPGNSYEDSYSYIPPGFVTFGSSYQLKVSLKNGEDSFGADVTVDLTPFDMTYNSGHRCVDGTYATYGYTYCYRDQNVYVGASGSASGTSW